MPQSGVLDRRETAPQHAALRAVNSEMPLPRVHGRLQRCKGHSETVYLEAQGLQFTAGDNTRCAVK